MRWFAPESWKRRETRAAAWRAHDAYNLVAVRQVGDAAAALCDAAAARRAYSAIVELLPKEVEAQRAVASVLKQAGDLEGARHRLLAALAIAPDDADGTLVVATSGGLRLGGRVWTALDGLPDTRVEGITVEADAVTLRTPRGEARLLASGLVTPIGCSLQCAASAVAGVRRRRALARRLDHRARDPPRRAVGGHVPRGPGGAAS